VSVEADGRLVQVKVDLGSRVKKGDVLAQIAPAEYSIRKSQAEADLEAAKADLGRMETLVAKDLATRQQLDEAKRRFEMARTNADMQQKKLGDTAVRSPIDGVVARRMVNLGEYVRTGSPAFQIVRPSPLKFKGDVPERYAPVVRIGDAVEAAGEALGDTVLKGEIVHVGAAVAAETRSFPIEARIDNPGERFKPGSFARLSILTGTKTKVVTVPEVALSEFAGNKRVFVVDGPVVRERRVEIEGKVGDRAIVSKGLDAGQRVAITAVDQLSDGASITVRADAPSASVSARVEP
jgi:RND family efflux transporter MFP subunit